MTVPNPAAQPYLRQRSGGTYRYATWSRDGTPVVRSLGRASVEPDGAEGWRRGRVVERCLTEAPAHERMLARVREHHADRTLLEQDACERQRRGVCFREVALDYLDWLADVRGAKPSALHALRSGLTEPGIPHRRGNGHTPGWIMGALGDRPARDVTTREISLLLRKIAATGVSPRTVNKARQLIHAVFNYGMRPHTWGLTENPAKWADGRREPEPGPLPYYSVEQIGALARRFESGAHRDPRAQDVGQEELTAPRRCRTGKSVQVRHGSRQCDQGARTLRRQLGLPAWKGGVRVLDLGVRRPPASTCSADPREMEGLC